MLKVGEGLVAHHVSYKRRRDVLENKKPIIKHVLSDGVVW
jgi:uncharacterized protein YqfA (UPF0365 family)